MAKKEILNNGAVTLRVAEDGPVESVLEIAEQAIEATEQALDILESGAGKVVTVTKNNPFIIAGAFVIGVSIGGFVAYKIVQKRLSEKFDDELSEQIAAAKQFHTRMAKEGEFESPESAVKALVPGEVVEAVNAYAGREKPVPYNKPGEIVDPRPQVQVVVEELVETKNVFVESHNPDPRDWDYNAEIADRELHPDQPYTISFEEFNENAVSHEQATLTYYTEDDTLADSEDKPVDNTEYTVGEDNLSRFGHGSRDVNVVYVRNEKIDMDFEVIRSNGSYQKEVLGIEPESTLQHSRRRPNRRSWRADE